MKPSFYGNVISAVKYFLKCEVETNDKKNMIDLIENVHHNVDTELLAFP